MNKYTFTYYGYIPSYRDFDQEDLIVEANDETEAWDKLNKRKLFATKGPYLIAINNKELLVGKSAPENVTKITLRPAMHTVSR